MIIGFTGTRHGMDSNQYSQVLEKLLEEMRDGVELAIHGGCVGADTDFHAICEQLDIRIEIYPGISAKNPNDLSMRSKLVASAIHPAETHFARNRKIVEECDVLYACPIGEDTHRGGTWYTINYAKQNLVPTKIFWRE